MDTYQIKIASTDRVIHLSVATQEDIKPTFRTSTFTTCIGHEDSTVKRYYQSKLVDSSNVKLGFVLYYFSEVRNVRLNILQITFSNVVIASFIAKKTSFT